MAVGDLACTFLGVVIGPDRLTWVHVGDGVVGLVERGRPRVVSGPRNGEFANETVFLTSSGARTAWRFGFIPLAPGASAVVLMTDGTQNVLFRRADRHLSQVVEQIARWLDAAPLAEASVALRDFLARHALSRTTDDCSLAVLRRVRPAPPPACPGCGRWMTRAVLARGGAVQLACPACGVGPVPLLLRPPHRWDKNSRGGGQVTGTLLGWVCRCQAWGLDGREVRRLLGVSGRAWRRWMRGARNDTAGERSTNV